MKTLKGQIVMRSIDGELLNIVTEGDPQNVTDFLRKGAGPDCL